MLGVSIPVSLSFPKLPTSIVQLGMLVIFDVDAQNRAPVIVTTLGSSGSFGDGFVNSRAVVNIIAKGWREKGGK